MERIFIDVWIEYEGTIIYIFRTKSQVTFRTIAYTCLHTYSLYGLSTKLTSTSQDQISPKNDNQMFGLQYAFHE